MRLQPCPDCWSQLAMVMGTAVTMVYLTNTFNQVVHAGTQTFMTESLATIKELVGAAPEPIGAAQFVRETTIAPGDAIVIVVGPADEDTGERPTSTIRAGSCPGTPTERVEPQARRPLPPVARERTATTGLLEGGLLGERAPIVPLRDADAPLELESIPFRMQNAPGGDVWAPEPPVHVPDDLVPVDVGRVAGGTVTMAPLDPIPLPGSLGLLLSAGVLGAWLRWLV